MEGWDPALYTRFEAERNRPSADLLARVPEGARRRVVDLGCGNGVSTQALVTRYGGWTHPRPCWRARASVCPA